MRGIVDVVRACLRGRQARVRGLALVGCLVLAACSSKPKVDWGSRVGTFTYDEAVLEMGPPDKSAELGDGAVVVDWYQGRTPTMTFGVGVGSYGGGGGVGVGQGVSTGGHGRYLRLIFDEEGVLTEVKKVTQ